MPSPASSSTKPDAQIIRQDALRRARVSAMIEGLEERPEDAALLDAWGSGEIDDDEVLRRIAAMERTDI